MNYYNCCKSRKNRAEISLYAATTTTATNSVSAALCYCLLLYRAALAPLCSLGLDARDGVGPYSGCGIATGPNADASGRWSALAGPSGAGAGGQLKLDQMTPLI